MATHDLEAGGETELAGRWSRRGVLEAGLRACGLLAGVLGAPGAFGQAPAAIRREGVRPGVPEGVQTGDVSADGAVVWSRADRPARLWVEWSTHESFKSARRVPGPAALENSDFTTRVELTDLPAGETLFYRVQFQDLDRPELFSAPVKGTFRTAPAGRRDLRFAWSGDVCGQGWGIAPDRGGMKGWETMRELDPDFFLHSGDTIYADNPILAEVKLDDGTLWKNLTSPEKAKVAETLDEFRGNYRYNLRDANLRRFNAQVPLLVQWDDHETTNNWAPGKRLEADARYAVKSCDLLAARAKRAFLEYQPLRLSAGDPERIYRSYRYGPSLELFMLDARSYRGPNTPNRQEREGPDTPFFGAEQVRWLKARLLASRSTWKVIACDMPLGLIVKDGTEHYEAVANGDGPALGRELEIAGLLRFIRDAGIRNVVWLTADVHYAAAHYYDPNRARFQEFLPFWEFVAGPLHAGTFGPGVLDDTFGPQVKYHSVPPGMKPNRPPSEGLQFFGVVRIDGQTEVMTVSLRNTAGKVLYRIDLEPAQG